MRTHSAFVWTASTLCWFGTLGHPQVKPRQITATGSAVCHSCCQSSIKALKQEFLSTGKSPLAQSFLDPSSTDCWGMGCHSHFADSLKVKVTHTRLLNVGFQSWSQFLAVSLQMTWVIIPAVGCHYFPPGLQLPPQPLRGLLPILLLGEQRHNGCEQFA